MTKFAIILGEPNSINSEILAKSSAIKKECIIIGSHDLLSKQLELLKIKRKINKISDLKDHIRSKKKLNILDVPLEFKDAFNVNSKNSVNYLRKCFNIAHNLCLKKKIKGFINCPIDKQRFFKNKELGITEYLASKNKVLGSEVMIIYNKSLSVVPLTTHINLRKVPKIIKKNLIITKIRTLNNFYRKYFKVKPKIAILGLNPHNAEYNKDSEEIKFIKPAINSLKKRFNVSGPYSADTAFGKAHLKKFNIIVGMYHDQVLAPYKTLYEFNAINMTLGLPYLRMTPDHGIANDKKKLNISSARSLNNCIEVMSRLIK